MVLKQNSGKDALHDFSLPISYQNYIFKYRDAFGAPLFIAHLRATRGRNFFVWLNERDRFFN